MRDRIVGELGAERYDAYGLTETYGPGTGTSCSHRGGILMRDGYVYFETVDPATLETVTDGTVGGLAITTLVREGAPLVRYRIHDLTRIATGACPCGSGYSRIDVIAGRTDETVKVRGVNMFPAPAPSIG